jgi:hypothetical protein
MIDLELQTDPRHPDGFLPLNPRQGLCGGSGCRHRSPRLMATTSKDASVLVDGLAAFDAMIQAETDLLRGMHRVGYRNKDWRLPQMTPLSPLQKLVSRYD